jgi:hypothetical protein
VRLTVGAELAAAEGRVRERWAAWAAKGRSAGVRERERGFGLETVQPRGFPFLFFLFSISYFYSFYLFFF